MTYEQKKYGKKGRKRSAAQWWRESATRELVVRGLLSLYIVGKECQRALRALVGVVSFDATLEASGKGNGK